jgi:hypothetical protein
MMGFDVDMKKLKFFVPVHGACPSRKWPGILAFLCLSVFLFDCGRKNPAKTEQPGGNPYRWDFNDLTGWVDDSQNTGGPQNYAVADGKLRIHTRAGTWDRAKVRTELNLFRAGTTRWRIFVPAMGEGDQASIGAFLYHSDTRELDFEIGYGKAADRSAMHAGPDDLLMFTTSQADPFKSSKHLIKREQWHDLAIGLTLAGSGPDSLYSAAWSVDGRTIEEMQMAFGPEIPFYIYCSVENLEFLGDHVPNQENYALFDYVEHSPQDTSRITAM